MRAETFARIPSAWRAILIGIIMVGLLSSSALARTTISDVDVQNKSDHIEITVKGTEPLKMTPLTTRKGNYVGFQFDGVLTADGRRVGINQGRIYNVFYSNYSADPAAVRVVVNTRNHVNYATDWSGDKKKVKISVWKNPIPKDKKSTKPAAKPQPETKVMGSVEEQKAAGKEPKPAAAAPVLKPASPKPTVKKEEPTQVAMAPSAPTSARDSRVSLNFLGADINDVLKALSVQSGKNIVSSKEVGGNITISLSDVTVTEALDYVAKLSGYSYAQMNDTYVVGPKQSVRALSGEESMESKVEVIPLNYTQVEDAMEFLKQEFPDMKVTNGDSSKSDDEDAPKARGGIIVISGPEGIVKQAKVLIEQIDRSMRDLAGESTTEVYHVKYVNGEELAQTLMALIPGLRVTAAPNTGFDLQAPKQISSSDTGARIEDTTRQKEALKPQALVISGPADAVEKAMKVAESLDIKTPQIKTEAKITSLSKEGEKKLGLTWNWSDFAWLEKTNYVSSEGGGEDAAAIPVGEKSWLRYPWDFAAKLDALITDGDAELLAAPNLVCLEGKPGVFFVGDEVKYILLVQQTPQGANVTTETATVGVQLRVIGDVSPDDSITLNLHPEVSTLKLNTNEELGMSLPIISRRFTDHVIRVKDGETIVIGGLIRDSDVDTMKKVPVLGDLPFFGQLFRHRDKVSNHTEVVMFITASILED